MKSITFLFNLLAFLLPLVFFPDTSELFEYNKMVFVYIITIFVSFFWTVECIKQKKLIFRNTPLTLPIFLFIGSQALSTIFSIDIHTSIFGYYGRFHGSFISSISYSILYFAFVSFMNKKKTLKLIGTLLVSSAIVSMYAFLEHFGYSPSCLVINGTFTADCFVQNVAERVFGTFGQPNWLAAYLVSIIPLVWSVMLSLSKYLSRMRANRHPSEIFRSTSFTQNHIIYLCLSCLLFTTVLFTKSRSGLLGFGITSLVFWSFTLKANFRKHIKNFFILNSIFIVLFILFNPLKQLSEPQNSRNVASDYQGGTDSGEIRMIVWQGAFDLWKKYPLIGTGVETFAFSYYEARPQEHNSTSEWNYLYNKAHNEYLNFAATTGTAGLVSYLFLVVFSIRIFLKTRKSIFSNSLFAGYLSILVTNFFGFSTVTTGVFIFLFPAMAITLEDKSQNEAKIKRLNNIQKLALLTTVVAASYMLLSILRYWLADYYYANGQITKAINLSPNEPFYRIELAEIYIGVGDFLHAEEEIEFVKKSSPRNIKLLKEVANLYGDLGEEDEKYYLKENEELQNILRFAPTDAQVWYQLSLSYGKLGQIEDAKNTTLKVIEMKPDYKLARKYLANIYRLQKDDEKAREQYEYILEYISPDDEEVKKELDNLL